MLNNPFRYLRRTWTMQSPRTTNALYSVHQPACDCASASSFLPIGICKSKSHQRALVEAWFIGVNEKGTPCTKAFFFVQVHLCSCVSFVKYMCTSNECRERVHPFFQEQSYCGHQSDNIGGCQCRHKQAVPNTMQFVVRADDLYFRHTK